MLSMDAVRPYLPSDMTACLRIFDGNTPRFFAPAERADFAAFLLAHAVAWHYLVIEREGVVVACGGHAVRPDGVSVDLCWGMVASGMHGTGIGKMLTRARLQAAGTVQGIVRVRLDTSQHTQGFYARFGFVPVQVVADGYGPGLDRWEMQLDLGHARPGAAAAPASA